MSSKRNPLGYYCPPNGAGPDYVAYSDLKSFVGFGLIQCWLGNQKIGDFCSFPRPVDEVDVLELREGFLSMVEDVAYGLWSGKVEKGDGDLDVSSDTMVFFTDENSPTDSYIQWGVRLDDDAILIEMGENNNDAEAWWLNYDALDDRQKVVEVLREAYEAIGSRQSVAKGVEEWAQKKGVKL